VIAAKKTSVHVQVKKDIQHLRFNLTERIWLLSDDALVLRENDWMANVSKHLANFEKQILTAIKADGWDGDEDIRKSQWTFAGSLFYSIIVITTIGECPQNDQQGQVFI